MKQPSEIPFLVGTYTDGQGALGHATGQGVLLFSLHAETGALSATGAIGGLLNPTWVAHDPGSSRRFHAVCEAFSGSGGEVVSILLNESGGGAIESRAGLGSLSNCHVIRHADHLFLSSYHDGELTICDVEEGVIGGVKDVVRYEGSGPNSARQESAHAHQAVVSPDGRFLYVCDLGSDAVWLHDAGAVASGHSVALKTPGGSGPRHMCFHPSLPVAWVLCELSNEVLVCRWNRETGALELAQRVEGVPESVPGEKWAAAIHPHPSGKAVAASFRSSDLVSSFAVRENGTLARSGVIRAGGRTPRDFNYDPSGRWMVVAHQDSDTLSSFRVDEATCLPADQPADTIECGTPVCVVFRQEP